MDSGFATRVGSSDIQRAIWLCMGAFTVGAAFGAFFARFLG